MFRSLVVLIFLFAAHPANAAEISLSYASASTTPLENPHDLKLSPDGKHLYVSDVGNDRVAVLDPETLALVFTFGSDHQAGTHDVDFDADGRVYVADTHNNRVTIYEMDGQSARLVGELSERIRGPEGVLVHPNGSIYVAGAWSSNLVAYKDGKVVREMQGLSSPHDVELNPDRNIWLADAGNDRMLLLSPELVVLKELKGAPYNFKGVRYQDILPDGTLIAADKNNHQVKIIAPDGTLLKVIGSGNPRKGPNDFTTPEGIEVRGNTLWISDSGNDRVVKYTFQIK